MLFNARFKTFEHGYKEIKDMVESWERSTGTCRPYSSLDAEMLDNEPIQDKGHSASGRKAKKGGKCFGRPASSGTTRAHRVLTHCNSHTSFLFHRET